MFAVTGWNVSANKLKTQTEDPKKEKKKEKAKKKRNEDKAAKRQERHSSGANATAVGSRMERGGIEGSGEASSGKDVRSGAAEKKRKVEDVANDAGVNSRYERPDKKANVQIDAKNETGTDASDRKPKKAKQHKKEKRHSIQEETASKESNGTSKEGPVINEPTEKDESLAPAASLKLTPLQSAMRAKLMGSRFRHLNESLYTKPSAESLQIFSQNPNFFNEYHAGFRQQVSSWPENPVNTFFAELKRRGKAQGKDGGARPLPRTAGRCKVADLGCGDAALAKKVKQISKATKVEVDSYDLQSTEPFVIKADIANLPIAADSVNVAVFCLALMGTNWIDFIEEAWRILHWKGELWIAEIKSRFSRTQRRPPEHSVGKRRKPNKDEIKKQKQQAEQEEAQKTIAEMDGTAAATESTDVSGFVAVLEKRGFGLADEDPVDLSNKMFVRMKFVKNRPPVKGKHAGEGAKKKNWREMLREGEDDGVDEAGVLQPCLYKLR